MAVDRSRGDRLRAMVRLLVIGGGLAVLVGGVFVGVIGAEMAFTGSDAPGLGSMLAATVLVAVTFEPARRLLTTVGNRVVFGQRMAPWEAIGLLSSAVRHHGDPKQALVTLARVVADGTAASRVAVSLALGEESTPMAAFPETEDDERIANIVVPIEQGGDDLGVIELWFDPPTGLHARDAELVANVAAEAGIIARTVQLSETLRRRVEQARSQQLELIASRAATVAAEDSERRRVERDLHDTCQQQAVAFAGKLGLAASLVSDDGKGAAKVLGEMEADLDRLAASLLLATSGGVRLHVSQGLGTALRRYVESLAPPCTVTDTTSARRPAEIDEAVYFCCTEAIQNAMEHSMATHVSVTLADVGGVLRFTVVDDGRGFDPAAPGGGTGLANIRNRLRTWNGDLLIRSSPRGTIVEGAVPLGRHGDPR